MVGNPELQGEEGLVDDVEGRPEGLRNLGSRHFPISLLGPFLPDIGSRDMRIPGKPPHRVDIDFVRSMERVITAMVDPDVVAGYSRPGKVEAPTALKYSGCV